MRRAIISVSAALLALASGGAAWAQKSEAQTATAAAAKPQELAALAPGDRSGPSIGPRAENEAPASGEPTASGAPSSGAATTDAAAAPAAEAAGAAPARPGSGSLLEDAEGNHRYYLAATLQFRTLAIQDVTPANDAALIWRAEAGITAFDQGTAFLRIGVLQRFVGADNTPPEVAQQLLGVVEPLDVQTLRPFDFQDMQVGLRYTHTMEPKSIGLEAKSLEFTHQLSFYLPTSVASRRQSLITAPDLRSQARLEIIDRLSLTVNLGIQYRFHRWAERAGLDGGLNTQLVLSGGLGLDWVAYQDDRIGAFNVGATAYLAPFKKYPSRETFVSDASSADLWLENYGWSLYVGYTPIKWFSASLSIEQGGPVLRDGIVNTFIFKREETEVALTISARY